VFVCGGTAVAVIVAVAAFSAAGSPTSVVILVAVGRSATAVATIVGNGVGSTEAHPTANPLPSKTSKGKRRDNSFIDKVKLVVETGEGTNRKSPLSL